MAMGIRSIPQTATRQNFAVVKDRLTETSKTSIEKKVRRLFVVRLGRDLTRITGTQQLSCRSLDIGNWSRGKQTDNDFVVLYSIMERTITYYLSTRQADYKMIYSFDEIKAFHFKPINSIFDIELYRKPRFFWKLKGLGERYSQCGDFTEFLQATYNMRHELVIEPHDAKAQALELVAHLSHFRDEIRLHRQITDQQVRLSKELIETGIPFEYGERVTTWIEQPVPPVFQSDSIERDAPRFACSDSFLGIEYQNYEAPEAASTSMKSNENETKQLVHSTSYDSEPEQPAHSPGSIGKFIIPSSRKLWPGNDRLSTFMDRSPDCAICLSPRFAKCDCEAKGVEVNLDRCEKTIMAPLYDTIRAWVWDHAKFHVLKNYRSRVAALVPNENLVEDVSDLDETMHKKRNKEWQECFQQYPDVLEYFYSLAALNVPGEDEAAVRRPPIPGPEGSAPDRSFRPS